MLPILRQQKLGFLLIEEVSEDKFERNVHVRERHRRHRAFLALIIDGIRLISAMRLHVIGHFIYKYIKVLHLLSDYCNYFEKYYVLPRIYYAILFFILN